MALIDEVHAACTRLAPFGWRDLLLAATGGKLDILQPTPAALNAALQAPLGPITRSLTGFEDFHLTGDRGIVPGVPARSLLYHAFASPNVVRGADGMLLAALPTVVEIEAVENLVFGIAPPKLASLVKANGGTLAIAVFAIEYRPAPDCADGANADLTFSRTGIARVGTARPRYLPAARGYWPEDENNAHAFRVIPARFTAWLAAPVRGSRARYMRGLDGDAGDTSRIFWIPVHKLFDGKECLNGLDLNLEAAARFFNIKLQRVIASLPEAPTPLPSGFPFVVTDGLAELVEDSEFGGIAVVPVVQKALVVPAMLNGAPVTYPVLARANNKRFATYETPFVNLSPTGPEIHRFPAYVHARTKVENGAFIDLNNEQDVGAEVAKGGYNALLYRDMTGEGWVSVDVPALAGLPGLATSRPAYCLLSAPDLFPSCGQRELSRWAGSQDIPGPFRDGQLWGVPPRALSDSRLPANLQLPGSPFDPAEDTIAAVVGMGAAGSPPPAARAFDPVRASILPDDAAGVFAPGWDASVDILGPDRTGTPHLAAYGLGSPFPEDAKLCAALSSFWPAVSPDVYRTMSPHTGNVALRGTVAPLTDAEIGQDGTLPWDGVRGPRVVRDNGQDFVEMASFAHVDYVRNAEQNRFSIRLTSRVTAEEYKRRVLTAARVHWVLSGGVDVWPTRTEWLLLSFTHATGDKELQKAQQQAGHVIFGDVYRVEACFLGPAASGTAVPGNPRLRRLPLLRRNLIYASAQDPSALRRSENDLEFARVPGE
jgi:hypothetical protein